jgi:hypothetical protein
MHGQNFTKIQNTKKSTHIQDWYTVCFTLRPRGSNHVNLINVVNMGGSHTKLIKTTLITEAFMVDRDQKLRR